jgi:signal transduction histidine kinase
VLLNAVPRPVDLRLVLHVAAGLGAGLVFVAFDLVSEAKVAEGTLTGVHRDAHTVVDHFLPPIVGILLGLSAYQLRLRARLSAAEEAASRAEALRVRLQKVERDQAVWVLAASVLHELSNPLHALGLILDEHDASAGDDARRTELVARARAQVGKALEHLRAVRSMPAVGEPETEQVPLGTLAGDLARDLEALASGDGLTVRLTGEPALDVRADPSYVRTILENLLDNALHALRAGGGRTITLGFERAGPRAVVTVTDDGVPLDPSIRETLFDPLRTTKSQGLGLGLPIARALARAMGGDLVLREPKTFALELPVWRGA